MTATTQPVSAPPQEGRRLGQRPALTGLRAVAAALVVLHHLGAFLKGAPRLLTAPGGSVGVDVFFVLSGFLITTLLLEEHDRAGRVRLGAFYGRRARRLLPAVVGVLTLWSAWRYVVFDEPVSRLLTSIVVVSTYTTNYYKTAERDVAPGFGHLWTLAVEEQFYLVWPLVLIFLLRRHVRSRRILVGLSITIALVIVNRAVRLAAAQDTADVLFRSDTHIDGMLWGIGLSLLWRAGVVSPKQARGAGGVAFALLLAYSFGRPAWFATDAGLDVLFFALPLVGSALVLSLLDADWWLGRVLITGPVLYLGTVSYGLYVWHVPVILFVKLHVPLSATLQAPLMIVGSVSSAAVSYWLIERRWLRPHLPTARG